jgi:hypothetical protein
MQRIEAHRPHLNTVIPELGSGIHAFLSSSPKAWIPVPSTGMTNECDVNAECSRSRVAS